VLGKVGRGVRERGPRAVLDGGASADVGGGRSRRSRGSMGRRRVRHLPLTRGGAPSMRRGQTEYQDIGMERC
jgi:hypothetical protein